MNIRNVKLRRNIRQTPPDLLFEMTSIIFKQSVCPTPLPTFVDSNRVLNLNWVDYDNLCRSELLFVCKTLAVINGHLTLDERMRCIRFFREVGISCTIRSHVNPDTTIWKIKYDSEEHMFSFLWMRACRGTLIQVDSTPTGVNVSLLNCPPIKFFPIARFQEYYGKTSQEILFSSGDVEYMAIEKVDGSMIAIYNDGERVTANTLGSFGEAPMQPGRLSFQDRTLSYVSDDVMTFVTKSGFSFVCELVTQDNHIVSTYNKEGLCLLYICDQYNRILHPEECDRIFQELFSNNPHWWRPRSFPVKSQQDLDVLMVKIKDLIPDVLVPEGFVLYYFDQQTMIPLAKTKDSEYKELHHDVALNIGSDRDFCKIDSLYLSGKIEELEKHCAVHELREQYFQKLRLFVDDICSQVDNFREGVSLLHEEDLQECSESGSQPLSNDPNEVEKRKRACNAKKAGLIKKNLKVQWLQRMFFTTDFVLEGKSFDIISKYLFSNHTLHEKTNLRMIQDRTGPLAQSKPISDDKSMSKKEKKDKKEEAKKKTAENEEVKKVTTQTVLERQMSSCFDFDGTLFEIDVPRMNKNKRKFLNGTLVSMWNRKASFKYCTPNQRVLDLFKGYMRAQIPTFVITGRKYPVEHKLQEFLFQHTEGQDNFRLMTMPDNILTYKDIECKTVRLIPDAVACKHFVYSIINRRFKALVYEDDMNVLSSIKSLGFPGIRVAQGNLEYPGNTATSSTHIIGICGPPGSLKTTILKNALQTLESAGINVGYVSSDESGERFQTDISIAVHKNYRVLIVDMCYSGTSSLSLIERQKCPYTLYTTVPFEMEEGVANIHPHYPYWSLNNVLERKTHQNLDGVDVTTCATVMAQKLCGVQNILPQCTQLFPDLYQKIEEHLQMLPPKWRARHEKSTDKNALESTFWPVPVESPGPNKIWRAFPHVAPKITQKSKDIDEIKSHSSNIDAIMPCAMLGAVKLCDNIIRKLTGPVSQKKQNVYHGFYYGLAIPQSELPVVPLIPGQTRPLVHHLTLDISDPLSSDVVPTGSVVQLESAEVFTDETESLRALKLEENGIISHPHVSLCWSGKSVDSRLCLESGKSVTMTEEEKQMSGVSLYLL